MVHVTLMVLALLADGFHSCRLPGLFWFRVYEYGLSIKNTRTRPLSFSERMRVSQFLKIGRYVITPLKPDTTVGVWVNRPASNEKYHGRK